MKLYFDIDTQIDFMLPAGALYVPGAEKLLPRIAQLNHEAIGGGNRLISTTCAHDEDDAEFRDWPHHCVLGTVGQLKPAALLVGKTVTVPRQRAELPETIAGQILLEKSELDLFTNPNTEALIQALNPSECLVYGVVTEFCVRHCAMGLLDRGYKVTLIGDAIQSLNPAVADTFLKAFATRGGNILRSNSH